ncbi:Rv0361 family membrane protein [Mycobacterium sp. NPDC003323]
MRRVLVLACAVIAVTGCTRAVSGTAAAPADARPWTAEEQIRDLVDAFESAWNNRDFDGLREMLCTALLAQDVFSDRELSDARADGTFDLTIVELEIDDASAAAIIENHGEDADEIAFVSERGEWKWCEY